MDSLTSLERRRGPAASGDCLLPHYLHKRTVHLRVVVESSLEQ